MGETLANSVVLLLPSLAREYYNILNVTLPATRCDSAYS